jgi:WD40 repeat protein
MIRIWDWQTGMEITALQGHTNIITDLAWSPDGTKLASSSWDYKVKVWDFATGNELNSFTHGSWVRAVAWSPDSRFLYSGGDDSSIKVWQVALGELSAEFKTSDNVMSLAAAPEEPLIAIALAGGVLKVLNVETGSEVFLERYKSGIVALGWSFDGRYLAAGTDTLIEVWDMERQGLAAGIDTGNTILALDWGSKSYLLATGSYRGIISLWSAESEESILKIAGHTRAVKALAWSPQGNYLASGGEGGVIRIWDLEARKELSQLRPGHSKPVEDLAWSPDGSYLASCGQDLLVRVWNMSEGEYLGAFTERIRKPFVREEGF